MESIPHDFRKFFASIGWELADAYHFKEDGSEKLYGRLHPDSGPPVKWDTGKDTLVSIFARYGQIANSGKSWDNYFWDDNKLMFEKPRGPDVKAFIHKVFPGMVCDVVFMDEANMFALSKQAKLVQVNKNYWVFELREYLC
jgi:hypothetical protein